MDPLKSNNQNERKNEEDKADATDVREGWGGAHGDAPERVQER